MATHHGSEGVVKVSSATVAEVTGFTGTLQWDASKPDGQPRRRIDPSRAEELLGWKATMNFREGLQRTVEWYLAHRDEAEAAPR